MNPLELTAVVKNYHALRPLRIMALSLDPGDGLAILGLDAAAAAVLVNLVTGATTPDAGDVVVFGQSTTAIKDADEWLSVVDRFGIVTPRAVFLEALTVTQNLALPFSLEIEPPPDAITARVAALAHEVGLTPDECARPLHEIAPASRVRVALGRALALDPAVLLLEHPTAAVPRSEAAGLGGDLRRIIERRGLAALTLTADPDFAHRVAPRVLALEPSTGRLRAQRRGWFGRL